MEFITEFFASYFTSRLSLQVESPSYMGKLQLIDG